MQSPVDEEQRNLDIDQPTAIDLQERAVWCERHVDRCDDDFRPIRDRFEMSKARNLVISDGVRHETGKGESPQGLAHLAVALGDFTNAT